MTVIDHLFVVNSTQKYPVFGIIGQPLGSRAAGNYSCSITVTGFQPVTSNRWEAAFETNFFSSKVQPVSKTIIVVVALMSLYF